MIELQRLECLVERTRNLGDEARLFGWKFVQVLVHGGVGLDFVEDSVKTRHHLNREREVRVARRIRCAELDSLCLRVRSRDGDANRG